MFEVEDLKMTKIVKVFAVKTIPTTFDDGLIQFLIFQNDKWEWVSARDYKPLGNAISFDE
jgi:hypothetical protein